MWSRSVVCTAVIGVACSVWGAEPLLTVGNLRCEYLVNPPAIDAPAPRLSWVLTSAQRGVMQAAYQVLVASSHDALAKDMGDLWDSGKVTSDRSIQVEYQGTPLVSRMRCHWKVRVWDQKGGVSAWSTPAFWAMGLLAPADWQAHWIGYDAAYTPSPEAAKDDALFNIQGLRWVRFPEGKAKGAPYTLFLRKKIDLPADRTLTRAVLALYAFNASEAAVNGKTIGQAFHWDRTARLDAKDALHAGTNVVTLAASHSDTMQPAAVGRLVLQFAAGADIVVPLDGTWNASRTEASGWQTPAFDDGAWEAAEAFDGTPWRGPPPMADLARLPPPYLRREFEVEGKVARATMYVTALGTYELRLNGNRVGEDVLAPGWTEFRKRVHYHAYDVTTQIVRGSNAIGAILGDGWYASVLAHLARRNVYGGKPRLLAQLVLEMEDGSTRVVGTDGTWKASYGPIRCADLLMGCEYDARMVMQGWDSAGYDDKAWAAVVDGGEVTEKGARVQAAVAEASRVIEELPARSVAESKPGCYTFDLGQNMVGWVRLKVHGAAGQQVTVRHGEMVNADGTIYTASLRSCTAADFYRLAGKGEEVLEPYFTFHGFRYVEVRGLQYKPEPSTVTGIVVHTAMRRTGAFECSHALVNQLYRNIIWGQKGNYLEVPTDCPQRDERMGWTGDTQFFAPTAAYNFDVAAFFTRWLATCRDNQNPDGTFPHVVPDIMGGGGATAWGDAALLCAYNVYRNYDDTRLVAEHFAAMEKYMRWLATKTKNGIAEVGGFGDWLNAGGGADSKAIDTAYYAYLARIMSEMAEAIGRGDDGRRYGALSEEIKAAFVRTFLQADGSLKGCSQTGYALAFSMGLLPDDMHAKAAEKFVEEVKRFHWHIATGFIGTPRILPALSAAGRDDVAFRVLLQETYPSWLFPVKNGATTMWERWNGWTPEAGFGDIGMNSFNHYAFGAVGEYLYGTVGGIRAGSPGYKTIVIRPAFEAGISWAKTSHECVHGRIATSWRREGAKATLEVVIPPNTCALVFVPTREAAGVTESGVPAEKASGVSFVRVEENAVVYAVGSGSYGFAFPVK